MQQWVCYIKGLDSVFGAREVERVGRQINGVEKLVVDYAGETLQLSAASRDVLKKLEIKLGRLGYEILDKSYFVKTIIHVEDISHPESKDIIQKKIGKHSFVQKLDIKPLSKTVEIIHSSDFSISNFICELNNLGISARVSRQQLRRGFWEKCGEIAFVLSVIMFLSGFTLEHVYQQTPFSLLFYVLSISFAVPELAMRVSRKMLLEKKVNYELLLLMLVALTMYLAMWFESAFIVVCMAMLQRRERVLGKLLKEKWSAESATESTFAFIKTGAERLAVPIDQVGEGAIIIAESGEVIPVDGIVLSGKAQLTNSRLNKAEDALGVKEGSRVFAGQKLLSGTVEIKQESQASNSLIALLHRKFESLQTQITKDQTKIKKYAEFAAIFFTLFFTVLLGLVIFERGFDARWMEISLSLLVISGFSFLLVSIQYSHIFSFIVAAKNGIYFFQPDKWKMLASIQTIILDKSGVVTTDKPSVQEVIALSDKTISEVLQISASLSQGSEDRRFLPISKRADEDQIELRQVENKKVVIGKSIEGEVFGQNYRLGSQSVMEKAGLITPRIEQKLKRWQEEGANIVLLADKQEIIGFVTVIDPVRDEISEFVDYAHTILGINVIMFSQDNKGTSQVLANRYGFDDVVSEMTDENWVSTIEKFCEKDRVLFVSNRNNLVPDSENVISLINNSLISNKLEAEAVSSREAIISLGNRLMPILNLLVMAKNVTRRVKRLLTTALAIKFLFVLGMLLNVLTFGVIVGLEFILCYWMLFSTYRPKVDLPQSNNLSA